MPTNNLKISFLQPEIDVQEKIRQTLANCLTSTELGTGRKICGKVRDTYELSDRIILVTTDRQSAFDRVLAHVPFKGQVLNLTSAWWFEQTRPIVPNHVMAVPDPNVTVAKKCTVFPVEFIVRGYISGSTRTSLWTVYHDGAREYCGNILPEGLRKNQQLETPLLTPTTKETKEDRPLSPKEIVEEGWMNADDWEQTSSIALRLFNFGQRVARSHGLILVDTKYELGRDTKGNILLIDEIHTPDSSRYWLADSYAERFANGLEPQNVDKEFLRLWFKEHCDPYTDAALPEAPQELVIELSRRYLFLYERITGKPFPFPENRQPVQDRIRENLKNYL